MNPPLIYSVFKTGFMLDLRIPKASDMKQKEQAALGVLLSTGIDILEADRKSVV